MSRKLCRYPACNLLALKGLDYCTTHLHPLALQQENDRLRSVQGTGFAALLKYPDFQRLAEQLAELAFRAHPLKSSQVAVTARSRGHNLSDGIVTIGEHHVTPGYAASVHQDQGRLGAAMRAVKECADHISGILDPHTLKPRDERPRCNRRTCKDRDTRQPYGVKVCGFCSLPMMSSNGVAS